MAFHIIHKSFTNLKCFRYHY